MDILTSVRTISSAQWSDGDRRSISAIVDGQAFCIPNDPANADRQAIQRWQDEGNAIADPPPLPPPPVPDIISDRQFFQQLAVQGVITQDEALAAVKTGAIPAAMQTLIDGLPAEQKFPAEMIVSGAVEFHRSSALVEEIAVAYHWTSDQVDALWRAASEL